MNRYRLNQILEVLLFPICDAKQGEKDILLSCYEAYAALMEESGKISFTETDKKKRHENYRRAQKDLITYLVEKNYGRVKSQDDIQLLCSMYYPMDELEERMMRFPENTVIENISIYYLEKLCRIALSLVTYRDGVAAIRQWNGGDEADHIPDIFGKPDVYNKIEIWNLLCRFIPPDIFIAIAAVEYGHGIEALYEQKAHIMLADKLLVKSLQKGIAENHLHFYVGFDYEIGWLYYMDLRFVEKVNFKQWDQKQYTRLEMALFRCMAAIFLEENTENDYFNNWLDKQGLAEIYKIVINLYIGKYNGEINREGQKQVYRTYMSLKDEVSICEYDYLLDKVYRKYIEYKTSSEFLLLYKCYQYAMRHPDDGFFARLFVQYIRLKNEYFYKNSQQNVMQGLKYFQKKYNAAKAAMVDSALPAESIMLEVFRAQDKISSLRKLEIRVAPWVEETELSRAEYTVNRKMILSQLYDQISIILTAYKRFILESVFGVNFTYHVLKEQERYPKKREAFARMAIERITADKPHVPALGIIFHFIKSEELEYISGNYCWRNMPGTHRRSSVTRMQRRRFFMNLAMAIEEMRETIPKLSEYLVGIDAASDENAMEPWMFSPAYEVVRAHCNTKPVLKAKASQVSFEKIQNIGFTYHVGEDFRHILSGLRHVDEVLEEFGYKPGDRLGHALALGIDIDRWIADNEVVPMPLQEHMENLLWIWGVCVRGILTLNIQPEVLEEKILNVARKIYWEPERITVKMLYDAYKKKFDVDHNAIVLKVKRQMAENANKRCKYEDTARECYQSWSADQLLLANYCPVFEERAEKVELIAIDKRDAELYKQLQDYLVEKIEQKGIYIETNPTSNLSIGDFSQIQKHPIFRLNQHYARGEHRALVTINSDDPAVFNTNVENELAYIYYALASMGYAKSDVLEWIDQIRQYGMEASFIQKEKSAAVIYREIEQILETIKSIRL